eukprot:TRINITY_DN2949_c0_g1_i1.p1 TRINITY_DN2949_c0_g1~~TRINITY_DN2949_c0_g1_i1.p1  ORF type:complete len:637 (-),score=121.69 TRINITY_DN2949_c0_g1_i1:4-1893(-)
MASKIKKIFKPNSDKDKKDRTPEGEEAQFEQLRTKFKNIKKDVNEILDATRRYVKALSGIVKPLEELSYCVGQFCHGESSLGGSAIAGASIPIKKAIEDYSGEQARLDAQIEKYLEALGSMQQRISHRDKLLSEYKSSMKTYTSAKQDDPKIQQYSERYNIAKSAYEKESETVTPDLKDFCDKKILDFEKFFRSFLDSQEVMYQRFLKSFKNPVPSGGDAFSLSLNVVGDSPRESSPRVASPRVHDEPQMPPPVMRNRAASSEAPSIPSRPMPSYESSAPQLPSRAARASVAMPNNDAPPLPMRTVDNSSPGRDRSYTVGATSTIEESPPVPTRANRMTIAPNSVQPSNYDNGNTSPRGPPQLPNRMSMAMNTNPTSSAVKEGFRLPGLGSDGQAPRLPQRASVAINNTSEVTDSPPPRLPQRASVMMNQSNGDTSAPPPSLPQRASVVIPHANGSAAPSLPPRASVSYTQTLPNNSNSYGNPGAPPKQPPKVAAAPQAAPTRPGPMATTPVASTSGRSISDIPEIPAEERTKYSLIFKREDPNNTGTIEGPAAYALFNRSGLSQDDLAQIWELADQDQDGALDIEEFVLAMFLINGKLKSLYTSIPTVLPPQFILTKTPNPQYQVYTH